MLGLGATSAHALCSPVPEPKTNSAAAPPSSATRALTAAIAIALRPNTGRVGVTRAGLGCGVTGDGCCGNAGVAITVVSSRSGVSRWVCAIDPSCDWRVARPMARREDDGAALFPQSTYCGLGESVIAGAIG